MTPAFTTRAAYLREAFEPAEAILDCARLTLPRRGNAYDFDTLVGTGLSGALVVPLLGRALRKHWAIVRKPGDGTHSACRIEGSIGVRWIFVDDLIDTGATLERVQRAVSRACRRAKHPTEYAGAYTYGDAYFERA